MPRRSDGRSGPPFGDRPGGSGVVDEAIDRLKRRIESGEFPPGHRLPPEPVLANELELSRLSLREAVRALALAGVLEVRHGAGTFVTDLRPDRVVEAIGRFLELADDDGVVELLECRRVVEPGATALAATRITDDRLSALRGRIDEMRAMRDPEELVRADLRFHADIVAAAGNATLGALASSVAQHTARARVWRALVAENVAAQTHQQHLDIHTALCRRDSMAAFVAATQHVQAVEDWVVRRLPDPSERP
ncbi:FadR/GntR family transcriptional regulator [Allosalinactinospora lopnorensis]|uniref:FadR/GntR family transcriptional regulator n=1 Tax=Allosalinactinospora lopnorensis TaxID=1352348 RepID=UPI000698A3E5|nr:FadR/GntR family transcriptional regulator [Allosalinactinospora lopnorensis]